MDEQIHSKTQRNQNLIPNTLNDSANIESFGTFAKQLISKYAGHIGHDSQMLEVGGFADCKRIQVERNKEFWGMNYKVLNLEGDYSPHFIKADITNCPEVKENQFDFIYSMDTFEHINKPWLAAKEISRLLKPGGICFIVTLFAWRYHKAPEDYFRYTPFGLMSLFENYLNTLEANWDSRNRRGLDGIGIQGDGSANDIVPVDMLGAWRENWRVYYLGKK